MTAGGRFIRATGVSGAVLMAALCAAPTHAADTASASASDSRPIGTARVQLAMLTPGKLNPTGRTVVLTVPLRASGPLGQVQVTITPDDQLSVLASDLVAALSRIVKPADLAKLQAVASPAGQITVVAAGKLGYILTYDPQDVELAVQIPLNVRSTRDISLGLDNIDQAVRPDRSAPFSAFLNYRIGDTYQFSGANKGQWEYLADLELAGRIGNNIAFENFATVDQLADHVFTRTASRFFYDIPGPALRLTAGDLITETAGFQDDPQISGLNVSHLLDTFYPNQQIAGSSSKNLVLNHDSDVQIVVNGIPVSQIHLGPGSYDLRNLPVAQGSNNVQAIITDDTGQRRTQNFSFFSDTLLLNPGLSEYTASLGVLAPLGDDGPQYSGMGAFSGFYRRGITQQLTLGGNLQIGQPDQVVGVDGVLGSGFGLFSLNLAANRLSTGQAGGAARLQYSYAAKTNSDFIARTVDFSVEYDSRNFLPLDGFANTNFLTTAVPDGSGGPFIPTLPAVSLDELNDLNTQAVQIAGSINQPLLRNLTLQLNGSYSFNRDDFGDTGSVSALLTYQAPFRTTFGLGVIYEWAPKNDVANLITGRGLSVLATLTHRFGQTAILTATADDFQQRASFTRTPSRPINDYFVNGDISHNNLGTSGDATAGFETTRGDIEAVYDTVYDQNGHVAGQQAGAFFNGSLDLAGLRLGLGRQITDSFAVIGKDPSLGDRQVLVETRFANETIAKSGLFGPAVVPLSSYEPQVIPYDVKNLPPGYNLGDGNFEVYPWLHSGFSLKVGTPYNITALGNLVDADGKPVSLVTGQAVSLTDRKAPHVEVITNRVGRFAAIGLAPGRYRITMSSDSALTYEIKVVQTPGMLMRLGVLHPATAVRRLQAMKAHLVAAAGLALAAGIGAAPCRGGDQQRGMHAQPVHRSGPVGDLRSLRCGVQPRACVGNGEGRGRLQGRAHPARPGPPTPTSPQTGTQVRLVMGAADVLATIEDSSGQPQAGGRRRRRLHHQSSLPAHRIDRRDHRRRGACRSTWRQAKCPRRAPIPPSSPFSPALTDSKGNATEASTPLVVNLTVKPSVRLGGGVGQP